MQLYKHEAFVASHSCTIYTFVNRLLSTDFMNDEVSDICLPAGRQQTMPFVKCRCKKFTPVIDKWKQCYGQGHYNPGHSQPQIYWE